MDRDLTIGIVSFNSEDVIYDCLESIVENYGNEYRVIVVDNNSTDGTHSIITHNFPQVEVFNTGGNYGFARGVNTIFNKAATPYTLIINADIRIDTTTIPPLLKHMQSTKTCGISAPLTRTLDGAIEGNIRSFPTLPRTIAVSVLGGNRATAIGMSDIVNEEKHYAYSHSVDWLKGAIWCVRLETVHAIGAMREDFFLYSEEREFAARAHDNGWTSDIVPESNAIHIGGEQDVHPQLHALLLINNIRYVTIRRGKFVGFTTWFLQTIGEILRSRTPQHRYALYSHIRCIRGVNKETKRLIGELGGEVM